MGHRLVVFGNAGAGKTTLARDRADRDGLAHLDLDTIAWQPTAPTERRPLADSLAELDAFVTTHDGWVVEGCYASLIEPLLDRADELIWIDPGTDTCVARCRARAWEPHKFPTPEAQQEMIEALVTWVREYDTRDDEFGRRAHQALFDAFEGRKSVS